MDREKLLDRLEEMQKELRRMVEWVVDESNQENAIGIENELRAAANHLFEARMRVR